ncbi:C40 family peptidase [Streptomyces sp. NPDC059582]|uniref:C40 family peptidase n=1 Tax=Streptomyces sp. NPDC059582 TaxID=3346875 RepID=UPI0036C3A21C
MAPERDTRPAGPGLPGMQDAVSREEIRRRINTLYDRAETDTGTYNATRAMSAGNRRSAEPARNPERRPGDPALDTIARQWFDGARAKLGPTVAAVLPADRMPDPPAAARPARAERPDRPAELPAGIPAPRLELEAPARRVTELTAGPVAALPAAPERGRDALPALPAPQAAPALPAALPAASLSPSPALSPSPSPSPSPDSGSRQAALRTTKGQIQDKLASARRLLARQLALRSTPPAALEAAPPAEPLWPSPAQPDPLFGEGDGWLTQPATGLDTGFPLGGGYANTPLDTGQFSLPVDTGYTNGPVDTGQFAVVPTVVGHTNSPVDTGQFSLTVDTGYTNGPVDTGQFAVVPSDMGYPNSPVDTGQFSLPVDTGYTNGPVDTGQFAVIPTVVGHTNSPVDTGQFSLPVDTGYTNGPVDTGQFAVVPSDMGYPNSPVDTGQFVTPAPVPVPEPPYGGKAAMALDFARAQIGRPCLWGATGPESYDCSSLTQAAWRAAGVALPRTALDQARGVAAIPLTDLQPGDLIFFHGDAGHVGLCTGNGTMIHAPGPGASIREESIFFAGQTAIHSAARPA